MAEQITGQNDDNVLGIPTANFRSETLPCVHNLFQFGAIMYC